MKRISLLTIFCLMLGIAISAYTANLDDFNGTTLGKMWTLRDPAKKATVTLSGGLLTLDLKAGADMYIKGVDGGVMLLTNPPDLSNFSVELMINPTVKAATQAPACHAGIVFFNEADWAYSAWGPYANTDIRLEDCVGASYRWRDQTAVGINTNQVAIDKEIYLKVIKTGDTLEFFAKGSAGDQWVSGGKDTKLGPSYAKGKYQIGIIAKSWGGSIDTTFQFDYFNVPELATTAVASQGKIATTWADIKR